MSSTTLGFVSANFNVCMIEWSQTGCIIVAMLEGPLQKKLFEVATISASVMIVMSTNS